MSSTWVYFWLFLTKVFVLEAGELRGEEACFTVNNQRLLVWKWFVPCHSLSSYVCIILDAPPPIKTVQSCSINSALSGLFAQKRSCSYFRLSIQASWEENQPVTCIARAAHRERMFCSTRLPLKGGSQTYHVLSEVTACGHADAR